MLRRILYVASIVANCNVGISLKVVVDVDLNTHCKAIFKEAVLNKMLRTILY